jgi:hypothetical protein
MNSGTKNVGMRFTGKVTISAVDRSLLG